MKLLIVGGGVTGTYAALLARGLGDVTLWEAGSTVGGRMRGGLSACDYGAQYITTTRARAQQPPHRGLADGGLLAPFDAAARVVGDNPFSGGGEAPDAAHFVAPRGFAALAEHFAASSGAAVECGRRLQSIAVDETGTISINGAPTDYSAVILTLPVVTLLEKVSIGGRLAVPEALRDVSYSKRWCLMARCQLESPLGWAAKYVQMPAARYICDDASRRGSGAGSEGTVLVVHSSVPFALEDPSMSPAAAKEALLHDLRQAVPELRSVGATECVLWDPSQVRKPFAGSAGFAELSPRVLVTGDAFGPSGNFDGCLVAAEKTVAQLSKL
ncbi:hypothetical protein DIPPA_35623 [Diplonema papillatum]|nr:hypothetical protein DIPPA_35623 [Diplonema papillatum]